MGDLFSMFWDRTRKEEVGDCWLWSGHKDKDGYGVVKTRGITHRAHRLSYVIHNGNIPEQMCVLHRCDEPACVNPEHLFIGTHADNMRDKAVKGRAVQIGWPGETNQQAKLNDWSVRFIRLWCDIGYSRSCIARAFKCNCETIRRVQLRKNWRHVS